jgi:hypothetical protein
MTTARDTILRMRKCFSQVLRATKSTPNALVAEMLDLFQVLEEQVPDGGERITTTGRRNRVIEYRVETFHDEEVLSEYRENIAHPFRCKKDTYDAAAAVLGESAEPLTFEDIAKRVNKKLGTKPATHTLRAALRFWMKTIPPLISRAHSKYAPHGDEPIKASAAAAWQRERTTSGSLGSSH